jgi:putative tRNA adenosine deaminase-associated protein
VPYFTAALARAGARWVARDLEVDPAEDLPGLADRMRAMAFDDQPVLLILEHEDEWFALVRVDGEDDPRVFLSDVPGVAHSPYAELLGPEDAVADVEVEADEDDDGEEPAGQPAGDADVLADFGVPPGKLKSLCEEGLPPADTLAEVATSAGFEDLLDSLR